MLAFLKRWRKAYLEDKGNRLHAEVEAERKNTIASELFEEGNFHDFEQARRDAIRIFPSNKEECEMW